MTGASRTGGVGGLDPLGGGSPRSGRSSARPWVIYRWSMLAVYLLAATVVALTGARVSTAANLGAALERGQVRSVVVEGDPLGPEAYGSATVNLVWDAGWERRTVEIRESRQPGQDPAWTDDPARSPGEPGRVEDWIHAHDQDVPLSYRSLASIPSSTSEVRIMGQHWTAHHAWGGLLTLGWLAFLVLIIGGPAPRGATRWAWFWFAVAPETTLLAVVIYTLTQGRPARGQERRLNGWWAALILVLVVPVLQRVTGP